MDGEDLGRTPPYLSLTHSLGLGRWRVNTQELIQ